MVQFAHTERRIDTLAAKETTTLSPSLLVVGNESFHAPLIDHFRAYILTIIKLLGHSFWSSSFKTRTSAFLNSVL